MTQIHISIRKPKTGGLDPVTGLMRFRPVRRHFDADILDKTIATINSKE